MPVSTPFPDIAVHIVEPPGIRGKTAHRSRKFKAVMADTCILLPLQPVLRGIGVKNISHLQQRGRIIAAVIASSGSGTAGIFPLCLGRQAVFFSLFPAQPRGHGHSIIPGYIHHRIIIALFEARIAPGILLAAPLEGIAPLGLFGIIVAVIAIAASCVGNGFRRVAGQRKKFFKLADSYLVLPEIERSGDSDLMHGRLISKKKKALAVVPRISLSKLFRQLVTAHKKIAGRHQNKFHAQRIFNPPGRCGL